MLKYEVSSYDFKGSAVRAVMENGEPWFVFGDFSEILGLEDAQTVIGFLDEDEWNSIELGEGIRPRRKEPQATIVSESGLYALVANSEREQARVFRRWLSSDVLPRIRKTGRFGPDGTDYEMPQRYRIIPTETRAQLLDSAVKTVSMQGQGAGSIRKTFLEYCELVAPAPKYGRASGQGAPSDLECLEGEFFFEEWHAERVTSMPGEKLTAGEAYGSFKDWFGRHYSGRPPSHVRFGRWMKKHYRSKNAGRIYYFDLKVE